MKKSAKPKIAPALERGLTILESLAASERPIGFNQFAAALELSKASVARLLRVLRERGYVVKDGQSGKYRPGPRMAMLGQRTALVDRLRGEGEPVLDSLVRAARNTAVLIYWAGQQMQCLARQTHPSSIPMQAPGNIDADFLRAPWGWIFLGRMTPPEHAAALANSDVGPAFLKRILTHHLRLFEENGYAYDDRVTRNTRRLAAPVFDHTASLVGAFGLGGNPLTIPDERVARLGRILVRHTQRLSAAIGWTGAQNGQPSVMKARGQDQTDT
ncbi:MAG: helix-turn-helix domain-containing protein [Kiritimatiellae bacterium]|nr:helix-turn-helix domain-containing protein [Kiritimatiellia bacterium]